MKAPAFAFYVRDWLCSRKVTNMSGDAVKAYIYLLCEAWLQEDRATLPNDEKELISMARINDEKWCKIKDEVLNCFKLNKNDKYYNERLLEVHINSNIKALNRKNKTKTKRKQNNNKSVTARESESEDESKYNISSFKDSKSNKDTYGDGFLKFWNMYPKKVGKGAAYKAWGKIKTPVEIVALIEVAIEWQKNSNQWSKKNGQFIPHPATYLNEKRWEDEKEEEEKWFI